MIFRVPKEPESMPSTCHLGLTSNRYLALSPHAIDRVCQLENETAPWAAC